MRLADGIYLIDRKLGSPGPTKTKKVYAYNDANASLTSTPKTCFTIQESAVWKDCGHYNFVQEDGFLYIGAWDYRDTLEFDIYDTCGPEGTGCPYGDAAIPSGPCWIEGRYEDSGWCFYHSIPATCSIYFGEITIYNPMRPGLPQSTIHREAPDGEDLFSFPSPGSSGTIANVAVWSFHRGKGKTALQIGTGTKVYGEATTENALFSWHHTDYATKPGGGSWTWTDLAAGTLKAGMYLYCITREDGWSINPGICRHLKVVITLSDGSEITLWPSADVSSTCRLMAGNPLTNCAWARTWADGSDFNLPYLTSVTPISGTVTDRYFASDLSEVPPRNSVIGGVTVNFVFKAYSEYSGSYGRAFLEIAGTKYYGTSHAMGSSLTKQSFSEEWATNPATSLAWDYDDFKGLKFGVHSHAGGNASASYFYLFECDADLEYQECQEEVSYTPLAGCTFEAHVQYPQIRADDLIFFYPLKLPERREILYVKRGTRRFQGLVWRVEERNNASFLIRAKSQQILLGYRMFPKFSYYAANIGLDQMYGIDELFSDEAPQYPAFQHMTKRQSHDTRVHTWGA